MPRQVIMVGLEVLVKIHPGKRHEFLHTFSLMAKMKPVRAEMRHRIRQALFENTGEPNCFLWTEEWDSAERLALYRESDHFRSLLGAVDVLGSLVRIKTYELKEQGLQ